mgnify:CR=1 FL=1
MICSACQTPNEADARFCEGCGSPMERRCAGCGTPASATARFCKSCGGSLVSPVQPAPAAPTRKTVTVLFADLAGSTTFEEKVDAETAREVLGQYHTLLARTAQRHRAGVTKYIGDGFMAVWGVPEISADDADHAVDAAVELQERFVDLAAEVANTRGEALALRVAVNTGEVVVGSDDADLVGDALNVAARLESQCPHGQVVVGEETWRSTRGRYRYEPLSPVQVKGRVAPVAVYQWAGRRSEPADSIPFVGRTHEFRRLTAVLDDAVAHRGARLVTVMGDPGVGKTRLASEFAASQQDAVVLQIRCAADGTVALAPVVEALRTRDIEADIPAAAPERDRILRDLNGMTGGVAGSVEETFWALRRYLEVLAARGLLILVLDDVQWADALLLDFVEHLSEWVRDAPVLMIALGRPELRESRPELVTVGGWVGDAIRLGGLEPGATTELAARVLGTDKLPTELLSRLPSSTGGNPLFVRELVAMLVHDGVLVAEADGWRLTIDADAIAVPPTIQALLASRLERINTADRRVLETASVIGTDFSPAAVSALSGASPAEVKASLDRMRRLELAQPSGAYSGDEPVWRFHHILIRDVAYRRLLKSDRADLHERFADWVRDGGQAGVFESDELLARHLELAHGYRCELGARDSVTAELALQSARCYLSAARRALDRDALVSAGAQAARGAALATADPALRAELLLVGCEAYLSAGDVAAGAPLVEELDRIADAALAPWATCYRCQYIVYTDPSRLPEVDERLQEAIDEFARRGDSAGSAKAYRVRAGTRGRLGRIGEAEADLFEALIAARQCGDHRQITAALGAAPNAALWGPSPAPKAGGRCLDVVRMQRMTTAAPSLEATSLRCLAVLELLRGRPDKARSMLDDARQIVSDLGLRHGLMETELYAGIIESMVGDPVAAEPHFRTALEGLDSLGVGADAGQAAALLARSLLAQGRIDEADRYAAESERIAGHNLKTAIGWRAARAEILSAQGRHREAVALARDAVAVAADTDLVLDYADSCLTLSRVLAAAGDRHGAAEARSKAESLYAAKDAVFLVGAASGLGEPVVQQTAPAPESRPRLTTANRASDVPLKTWQGAVRTSATFVYEDHRRVSGEPLEAGADLHAAAKRKVEQYPHVEAPVLAARGEGLALVSLRWWDDAGNQRTSLDVYQVNEADELTYQGRFDEDDFAGAYRVLNERYYRGEGAAFAVNGMKVLEFEEAFWAQDVEAALQTIQSDFRWCAAASALKPGERSVAELFAWRAERLTQVASFQDCLAALRWLSPDVCISLCEIRATGHGGEAYRWSRFYVSEYRDGLSAAVREFDIDDEAEAFAYAESLLARARNRLVVCNRASMVADGIISALRAKNGAAATDLYAETLTYDDRRRLRGNPVTTRADGRRNAERMVLQYSDFQSRILAVRGERSALVSSRWSDDAGNESAHLHVFELDDQYLISYEGRFDEDDFAAAYRVLEERYYAGEGAAFAAGGLTQLGFQAAIWAQDAEAARSLVEPDFVWIADPSTLKPGERSLDEMFAWRAERLGQVGSFEDWLAALQWLSPEICVVRAEMKGEDYRWSRIYVTQFRDALLVSGREFDIDDEETAFAYAESLLARARNRLVVCNRASMVADGLFAALRAKDLSGAPSYAERLVYDDRRRIPGSPMTCREDLLGAAQLAVQQYSSFEHETLAVRGERSVLVSSRWSDAAGNESKHLHVFELDNDGLIGYEGRFDEDDFASAYRVLEERYYAGEGKAFAAGGLLQLQFGSALGASDLEAARPLVQPDFVVNADPSTLKPAERSLEEIFGWAAERLAQVASFQMWIAVPEWMSSEVCVSLLEMRGTGHGGEKYLWPRYYVTHLRDGLLASGREFGIDDEAAAFAYADSLLAQEHSRLVVRNRASVVADGIVESLRANDSAGVVALFADGLVYDDRRHLGGGTVASRQEYLVSIERFLHQYSRFDNTTLAVRGERLALVATRFSDSAGNATGYLHLFELDDEGLVTYEGRFDEDDFLSAYVELDRRYYSGEGVEFADGGRANSGWVEGIGRRDIEMVRRFSTPDFRWLAPPSSLKAAERTVEDMFEWMRVRGERVASQRHWQSVIEWVGPDCAVGLTEVTAVGFDGEDFRWTYIVVTEVRDGRAAWVREFDTEGEAFAYAESVAVRRPSRLAVTNRASAVGQRLVGHVRSGDVEAASNCYADSAVYDDRRQISGEPVAGRADIRAAIKRITEQFQHFEFQTLAVRGERLHLARTRWSDTAGNETAGLVLAELDADGLIVYDGRFDEDDFESAYLEMERRYLDVVGKSHADASAALTQVLLAETRGDLDSAFAMFAAPGLRIESRSRSVFPGRSAAELRRSVEELGAMVGSYRVWSPAACWMSPEWVVARHQRETVGSGGDALSWSRIYVMEIRNGLAQSVCEFDAEDEEHAFAYAEERMRVRPSRLAIANRASEIGSRMVDAIRAGDVERAVEMFPVDSEYGDFRRVSGDPIVGKAARRQAIVRSLQQFSQFDLTTIAVRGENLALARSSRSDDAGNESTVLVVGQIDDDGHVVALLTFDDDDFENAYQELERRYYGGEGAPFAEAGAVMSKLVAAGNRGDNDAVFELFEPGMRVESRSRTIIPSRALDELRSSVDEFKAMVRSSRIWCAAVRWLSPTCAVVRHEREAVGHEGQSYEWSRIYALESHGGRFTGGCEFDIEFEDEAFAYAEERLRASASRLAVTNRASVVAERLAKAIRRDSDLEAALAEFASDCAYEDRRRLSGDPIVGVFARRAALERVVQQYGHLTMSPVAVRGDRLVLERCCRSDDSGNESIVLVLGEINCDDHVAAYISFDEDDFEGAYRELERRYYAGEGAASAPGGRKLEDFIAALNRGDLDSAFTVISNPDLRIETRSRAVFPDRSAAELREDLDELLSMTSSVRWWYSNICWLSANVGVGRQEREGIGLEGQGYAWTDIYAFEFQGDAVAWICRYNVEDETQAFADAEARTLLSPRRLAVANRAGAVRVAGTVALQRGEIDTAAGFFSESVVFEDRRRMSGEPPASGSGVRAALTKLRNDYSHFDGQFLAVRGERLVLARYVCRDEAGNQTSGLSLTEIGSDGLNVYECRYDEDDFGSAYAELERRYYAGEGAAFAVNGMASANYLAAVNRGDFKSAFEEFTSPDLRIESRAKRSGFAVGSASEYQSSFEELQRLVGSFRDWFAAVEWVAPNWMVIRYQRVAVGLNSEDYQWDRICVCEVRNGRLCYICDFDLEDEEAAFAYAQECANTPASRLPLTNRASDTITVMVQGLSDANIDAVVDCFSEDYLRGDRRRILGSPLRDKSEMRAATERMLQQYNHFQWQTLAVRGERLTLGWTQWSDDAGNASTYLAVGEVDTVGRLVYEGRFDGDDFDSAYDELERRYYAGEGAAAAESGMALSDYVTTKNRGDLDRLFNSLSAADLRIESRSASVFVERTAAEYRASVEQLLDILGSTREWFSAVTWVSLNWFVGRFEREAVGRRADDFAWDRILVGEMRDGRLTYICMFNVADEDAAFAYAEERAKAKATRLPLTNRASDVALRVTAALSHGDPDAFVAAYHQDWVRDDQRRLAGAPIGSRADMRVSVVRMLQQFNHFEWRTLAVRGTRLAMGQSRSSDSDGNVSTYLHVFDVDDDGLITYEARFDEDDFDSAYRELDRRYFAGEGADFADMDPVQAAFMDAVNHGDLDAARKVCLPSMRVVSPPTTLAAEERSLADFFRWVGDRVEQSPTVRHWMSTMRWMSASCLTGRIEIQALGSDGHGYSWPRVIVTEIIGGRFASIRQFDVDDEDSAFVYADEIVAKHATRLPATNIASEVGEAAFLAMCATDLDAVVEFYADDFVFDDHRRLSGDPIPGKEAMRAALERVLSQFPTFELRGLAVRGDRLALGWSRWSDGAGNESRHLHLVGVDQSGHIVYDGRFDEDDFDSAYRELDRRYFAGEAAEFAEMDPVQASFMHALNHCDLDAAKKACLPSLRVVSSPDMLAAEERTLAQFFSWVADRFEQSSSVRHWVSSLHVVSANCVLGRVEIEVLGSDRDGYSWPSRIMVTEISGGRFANIYQFDPADEGAAFTCADRVAAKHANRLRATNIASEIGEAASRALEAGDWSLLGDMYSDDFVFDDHRRLSSGYLIEGREAMSAHAKRIREQFSVFEPRPLAVRGERLALFWNRRADSAGNETIQFHVVELDADGRVRYEGRFDEDDFEGAYAEMERRYYAGEGAAFAENGLASANYVTVVNRGDFATLFDELTRADVSVENHSRSAFPDRGADALRASLEQLTSMMGSVRYWFAAITWISPTTAVFRMEREAVGKDGEQYAWSRISVGKWEDGKLASLGDFDPDDEDAAFAYAQSIE